MSWATYLARGVYVPIYHMCNEASFYELTANETKPYFPTSFEREKFIHCTEAPNQLLDVGNHFYKSDKGPWICLELDPYFLLGTVVYEAPAGVGNIEAMDHKGTPKLPHVYGGLPMRSIVKKLRIERSEDGTFLSIEGLTK